MMTLISSNDGAQSVASLPPRTGSAYRVKLLQLWIFDRLAGEHWQGIWETMSLHDQGTKNERWTLRRAFITKAGQSFEDRRENIPTWLLLEHCSCVKLETKYTPNS